MPGNEDTQEVDLKKEDCLENASALKNEVHLRNEDNLKNEDHHTIFCQAIKPAHKQMST